MKTAANLLKLTLCILFVSGFCTMTYAQVNGKVTSSEDNAPLPAVSVRNINQQTYSHSDINGYYSIGAQLQDTLEFSFLAHISKKIVVTRKVHDIVLDPVAQPEVVTDASVMLETVNCTGTLQRKKMYFTGSCAMTTAIPNLYSSREEYRSFKPNKFQNALDHPLSTFSVDVDAASYANIRRYINSGFLPPKDAVRSEEMINYFAYDYPASQGADPMNIITEVSVCPWNKEHRLVHIGVKANDADPKELPASNLVFLIDVSGSMNGYNRLPLLKSSLKLLVSQLRDIDRVAIVTYAGHSSLALPSTSGKEKGRIIQVLEKLEASGSTAGGAGIQQAYEIAGENFIPQGNNRIILATDGDFNVGISSENELEQLIETKRKSGIFLTVLGYGMGNYKDNRLQVLAQKGNGNHAYIDNLNEARKVLVSEFSGSMYTLAKDVKLQIEFNPAKVQSYRLIGYESRLLEKEDFNDDKKDAGEIGIGHTVTALYEIIPTGVKSNVDPLKYQKQENSKTLSRSPELLTVKLRYKPAGTSKSKKLEMAIIDKNIPLSGTSDNFRFSAAVAGFGMLLTHSSYIGEYRFKDVIQLAEKATGNDPKGYRKEFIRLVQNASLLTPKEDE